MNRGFGCSYKPMESNGNIPAKAAGSLIACITRITRLHHSTSLLKRLKLTSLGSNLDELYKSIVTNRQPSTQRTDCRMSHGTIYRKSFHQGGAIIWWGAVAPITVLYDTAPQCPTPSLCNFGSFRAERGFSPLDMFQNKYCK